MVKLSWGRGCIAAKKMYVRRVSTFRGNSPLRLLAIRRTWKLYPRPPVAIQKHSGRHGARVIFGAEKEKVPAVFRLASFSRRRLKTIWYPRCQRAETPRGVTLAYGRVGVFFGIAGSSVSNRKKKLRDALDRTGLNNTLITLNTVNG